MKIENDTKLDFNDVLIKPKRNNMTSRNDVNLENTYTFKHSKRTWTGIPIIASNMDTTGTFEMYKKLKEYKMITVLHKFYTFEDFMREKENLDPNYYSLSTGISDMDYNKTIKLIDELKPYFLTVDIANGYSQNFVDFCKKIRITYPDLTIIAGNVATSDMVQELLISAKVDIVKCGIGGGSVCSTRIKTGVGVPQLSVSIECSETANGLDGHIISDGGCVKSGDITKAFGAGAHFVMLGSMLSGHDESGGDLIEDKNGDKFKLFYGMSSEYAQNKHMGGMKKYRSSEGKLRKVPYKYSVSNTINDILGGIRSCGTYIGARRLKDFSKCTTFIKVNRQVNEIYSDTKFMV